MVAGWARPMRLWKRSRAKSWTLSRLATDGCRMPSSRPKRNSGLLSCHINGTTPSGYVKGPGSPGASCSVASRCSSGNAGFRQSRRYCRRSGRSRHCGRRLAGLADRRVPAMPERSSRTGRRTGPLFLRLVRLAEDAPSEGYPYEIATHDPERQRTAISRSARGVVPRHRRHLVRRSRPVYPRRARVCAVPEQAAEVLMAFPPLGCFAGDSAWDRAW
jgi:hypothetical protein